MSNRRSYDVDYKKTLVSLYENGHSVKNLSEEHGIAEQTIYRWIKKYSTDEKTGYSEADIEKIKVENARLKTDNDILKKVLAMFTQK